MTLDMGVWLRPEENVVRCYFANRNLGIAKAGLRVGEARLYELLDSEPKIRNVSGAQTQNVFKRFAHFAEAEIDAESLEQIDERSRALGQHRRLKLAERVRIAIETVIRDDVHRAAARTVTDDVEKAPCARLL